MKKIIAIFLSMILFISSLSFSAFAETWDGEASSSFAKGSGSESDPYLISSASEFDYLLRQLDLGGNDFSGKYFELTNDIVFNDETFEFQPDTGLVKVTDGENVIYFGTDIPGDKSGENETFDETASNSRYIYTSDNSAEGVHYYEHYETYGGKLNFLHSAMSTTGFKAFKGHLDGKGYSVKGVLASGDASTNCTKYAGLFRTASDAVFKNIKIENSFVFGSGAGGIVGNASGCEFENCEFNGLAYYGGIAANAENTGFKNCTNNGIMLARGYMGGIVGTNISYLADKKIESCVNNGIICPNLIEDNNGGIVGKNTYAEITNCVNNGVVNGEVSVGGIAGLLTNATVTECVNNGTIAGIDRMGGIVGELDNEPDSDLESAVIEKCKNYGTVECYDSGAGGIVGYIDSSTEISVFDCLNEGTVIGFNENGYIGGIVGNVFSNTGNVSIKNSKNIGKISGGYNIGGISGYIYTLTDSQIVIELCKNIGEISGNNNVGGVVGTLHPSYGTLVIQKCYNSAPISGEENVGGIAGRALLGDSGATAVIKNCYNSASVTGNVKNAGGFIGTVDEYFGAGADIKIENSYTIGAVFSKSDSAGRLVGNISGATVIENCHYSIDLALEKAYGAVTDNKLSDGVTALVLSEMKKADSFDGYDFENIWTLDESDIYEYPTIQGLAHENHTEEKVEFMLGDINDDKEINQYDYILAKRIHFNTYTPNDEQKLRGDVNKDGSNNQYDYILIKRHHFKNYTITG